MLPHVTVLSTCKPCFPSLRTYTVVTRPLPTNAWFQNLALDKGDQPVAGAVVQTTTTLAVESESATPEFPFLKRLIVVKRIHDSAIQLEPPCCLL